MPNDWIYACAQAACEAIDDDALRIDDSDSLHQFADGYVDIYNHDRYAFAAACGGTDFYSQAEDEASDLVQREASILDRLGAVQFCAARNVAATILRAWEENKGS